MSERASGVHIVSLDSASAVAKYAAAKVLEFIESHPGSSVVFPTGATPRPLYALLRENPSPRWKDIRLFHLDDYVTPQSHQKTAALPYQSFDTEIRQQLWDFIPGKPHYFTVHPAEYEAELTYKGTEPAGLVILGIGGNGHIAFNEPPCKPDAPTREIALSAQTIQTNFGVAVGTSGYPTHAVTLGLSVILTAKQILLLATGEKKRDIIQKAFDPTQAPSDDCPASWLKQHPNVTVLTDFPVH